MSKSILFVIESKYQILSELLSRKFAVLTEFNVDKVSKFDICIIIGEYVPDVREVERICNFVITSDVKGVRARTVLDRISLNGHVLSTIVATRDVDEGVTIFTSANGSKFCVKLGCAVVAFCKVLMPFLLSKVDLVLREIELLHQHVVGRVQHVTSSSNVDVDQLVKKLKDVVVEERRKLKVSRTMRLLLELAEGNRAALNKLPSAVLDLLAEYGVYRPDIRHVNFDVLREIIRKLEQHVYPK